MNFSEICTTTNRLCDYTLGDIGTGMREYVMSKNLNGHEVTLIDFAAMSNRF